MSASLILSFGAFVSAMSFAQVFQILFSLALVVGLLMLFRPLLTGIVRALVIALRPRLTAEELAARRARALASRA